MQTSHVSVLDASGHVLGRLASHVAKRLLNGERIIVVNSEKTVVVGAKLSIFADYKDKLNIKTLYNPQKTPRHPRRPDTILRRAVRGMLPHEKYQGKSAYKRLQVYVGVPPELSSGAHEKLEDALRHPSRAGYVSLGEVAKQLGWRP